MASGKFRSESHLIDQKAVFFVRENLPTEWVVRELTPDYGLDLDVEVFEKKTEESLHWENDYICKLKGPLWQTTLTSHMERKTL